MKRQKKDKRRQSTQQLMGVKKITDYCISTDAGDLVFYIIKPTNISVLPAGAVSAKIRALSVFCSARIFALTAPAGRTLMFVGLMM